AFLPLKGGINFKVIRQPLPGRCAEEFGLQLVECIGGAAAAKDFAEILMNRAVVVDDQDSPVAIVHRVIHEYLLFIHTHRLRILLPWIRPSFEGKPRLNAAPLRGSSFMQSSSTTPVRLTISFMLIGRELIGYES